jgi:hypothetical protein
MSQMLLQLDHGSGRSSSASGQPFQAGAVQPVPRPGDEPVGGGSRAGQTQVCGERGYSYMTTQEMTLDLGAFSPHQMLQDVNGYSDFHYPGPGNGHALGAGPGLREAM